MARGAGRGSPEDNLIVHDRRAAGRDEVPASRDRANRHVGDPGPTRISQDLIHVHVRRHLDDAFADRLGQLVLGHLFAVGMNNSPWMRVARHQVGLDNRYVRTPRDCGEVIGRLLHLLLGQRFREHDHRVRVPFSRLHAVPEAVSEIIQLAKDVTFAGSPAGDEFSGRPLPSERWHVPQGLPVLPRAAGPS